MDMRCWIGVLLLMVICSCEEPVITSGPDTVEISYNEEDVKEAVYNFNKALVDDDTLSLNMLLHRQLTYGHSNGWVENKFEIKADLNNGIIDYHLIDQPELEVLINGPIATVRGNGIFKVDFNNDKDLEFNLHVMQTWVWEDGRWQMLNRQAVGNKK